jgi:hypothetical protein
MPAVDFHLVVEPIMPRGIQLLGVWAVFGGAYIWSKVSKDVFPYAIDKQKTRLTSFEPLTSTIVFAALSSPQAQKSKRDNRM